MNICIGLLIPFLGTVLGSAMVFLMKNKLNKKVEKILTSVSSKFPKTKLFNRLALVSSYFMNVDLIKHKNEIYKNLINEIINEG